MQQLTRREWLKAGLTSLGAAALGGFRGAPAFGAPATSGRKPPNLLFVFPDQFRRQALTEDPVDTPVLDRFARESRVFTQAVSNCPVCSPYRAMMLTGRYPYATGVTRNCHRWIDDHCALRPTETCISDVLADAGYDCGYIGKWHLDTADPRAIPPGSCDPGRVAAARTQYLPPNRRHGFNYWHAFIGGNRHLTPQYWICSHGSERFVEPGRWGPCVETDAAIGYLANTSGQRRHDRPFALFVSMNPPHPPYDVVPSHLRARYSGLTHRQLLTRPNVDHLGSGAPLTRTRDDADAYFGAITGVDQQFGRILQALEMTGHERDTLVVFTSDHGDMLGSHGLVHKNYWYEESVGVPLLIRFPGRVTRGTDDLIVNAPDLMPTLLGLMGLAHRTPRQVQGRNLAPAIRGVAVARPESSLYLAVPVNGWSARGIRTHRHTLAIEWEGSARRLHLFDNVADPYQRRNLADARSGLANQLQTGLLNLLEETDDPYRDRLVSR